MAWRCVGVQLTRCSSALVMQHGADAEEEAQYPADLGPRGAAREEDRRAGEEHEKRDQVQPTAQQRTRSSGSRMPWDSPNHSPLNPRGVESFVSFVRMNNEARLFRVSRTSGPSMFGPPSQ